MSFQNWRHLGVWLESSLSWDYYINYICAKANKVLGLIGQTFGPKNPEGVLIAYETLVHPILEYGCQVWNPYLVKHIKSMESIQRRATQVICGSEKEYLDRLGVLKWLSLELWRKFINSRLHLLHVNNYKTVQTVMQQIKTLFPLSNEKALISFWPLWY